MYKPNYQNGTDSQGAKKHFIELDKKVKSFAKSLKNKNTAIIISADHGLIDTKEKNKIIELKNHPRFVETLAMPLSGEPRVVYCYVRPQKVKEFKNACKIYKSNDLVKSNYFGLFKPNEKLKDRIGDYVLIMK
ncbi:MAG: alkaline phosphatase family protein, partial [Patescibacteria group bacterium]